MVRLSHKVGDTGSISGLGRFPEEANGNPLQYSCLENPMDGGASQATVHGVAKSRTLLSDFTFTSLYSIWKAFPFFDFFLYFFHLLIQTRQTHGFLLNSIDYDPFFIIFGFTYGPRFGQQDSLQAGYCDLLRHLHDCLSTSLPSDIPKYSS